MDVAGLGEFTINELRAPAEAAWLKTRSGGVNAVAKSSTLTSAFNLQTSALQR
jgi:hypothetical protein